MDIVLLQLPFWGIGCPPLGLALLKSYLSSSNVSCKVFDINAHAYHLRGKMYREYWELKHGYNFCEDYQKMLEYYKDNRTLFLYYMNEIKKLNPRVVGCSCQNSSLLLSEIFLEDLRNNLPLFEHILGGPGVASFMKNADRLLSKNYIDAVNLDEGEVSLVSYFRNLEKGNEEPVAGIVYKKDGSIIRGGQTIFVKNLDELPFPDFSDFDLKYYYSEFSVLPSYTSRGCINKCIYCSARNYMKPFRFRTARRMFGEIKYLKQQYPEFNYIRMCDNISNANIKELESFCDLMIEAKLGIEWNLENAVIRKEMCTPLYKKLKKAGCTLIGYGLETSSPRLLQNIGKVLSKDVDTPRVLEEGKREGIYIVANIMFGLPGETEDDFIHLIEFLRKNRRAFSMINPSLNFCEFYPGSAGSEYPEKYGLDLTKGHLFWESKDGLNTYFIRMKRFETFCRMAKKSKLDNLFNIEELPNKHSLLFQYYFASREYDKAFEEYSKIAPCECSDELKKMYKAIKTGDFEDLKGSKEQLREVLPYSKTFEEVFFMSSLIKNLEDLEKFNPFEGETLKPWKRKLRSIAHRIVGYDKIDKKISAIYSVLKIIDGKISCCSTDKKSEYL